MDNLTTITVKKEAGLRFLLAPEDSSVDAAGCLPSKQRAAWNLSKSLLWIVFSVLIALLVGQL